MKKNIVIEYDKMETTEYEYIMKQICELKKKYDYIDCGMRVDEYVVAIDDERERSSSVIGFCEINEDFGEVALNIYVSNQVRRIGVGKSIIQTARDYLASTYTDIDNDFEIIYICASYSQGSTYGLKDILINSDLEWNPCEGYICNLDDKLIVKHIEESGLTAEMVIITDGLQMQALCSYLIDDNKECTIWSITMGPDSKFEEIVKVLTNYLACSEGAIKVEYIIFSQSDEEHSSKVNVLKNIGYNEKHYFVKGKENASEIRR